jgi:adenylate cyclase
LVTRVDAGARSATQTISHDGGRSRPRLSIVVLPFANLSSDPEQQYFADGITEDLTTDLSRIDGSFVISRNTAFAYRDKPVDTKQIGRELGVRYVLEGSARRSGNQIRVSTQLIDAETDAHLWAERFDGGTVDLFALQDEVTSRIAVALDLELVAAEAARPTEHPEALDYILRGRAALSKPGRDGYAQAIDLFESALGIDPGSVEARSRLASVLASCVFDGMTDSIEDDIARAEGLVDRALAASPRSPVAHFAAGQVRRVQGRLDEAISEYETVLTFDRNSVRALADIGRCRILIGPIAEAILAQEQAIRLSPRDPQIGFWYFRIGEAHLLQSQIDEAILWFGRARSANPAIPFFHAYLASAYALKGETARAAAELAETRRLAPEGNYSTIARLRFRRSLGQHQGARPEIRALFEATFYAGLRKAGMPEE